MTDRAVDIPWWRMPLRIIRYDSLNDYTSHLNGDYAEHAREVRRVCHANCEWIMANGGSSPGTASAVTFDTPHFDKNPTVGSRDILRDYIPHARKEGIRVVAYINLHWFSYAFADEHPSWEQQLANGMAYGRENPLYGNGTTLCVNTPWRDWAFLLIREAMKTGIDGVFLDGPVVFPGACYCPVCRESYAEQNQGASAPEVEDASDEWMRWGSFREQSMARFLADAQQAVRSVHEEGIVYCNAGGYQLSNSVARNPWRLEPYQETTGAEVFVHFGVPQEDVLDTTVMAKFLSAGKNPAVVFSDHATGSWHYVGLNEAELCREFYQTVAGGASPWIAMFTPALDHQRRKTLAPITTGWSKLEAIESYLALDEPAARVAVLRSDATALAYRSNLDALHTQSGAAKEEDLIASAGTVSTDDPVAHKRFCEALSIEEFRGWCELLTRAHIPFSVIRDRDCTRENLHQFDALVLPNTACLADLTLAAIDGFVEEGGTIVSTFETGWYDETGGLRAIGTGGAGIPVQPESLAFSPSNFEEYAIIAEAGARLAGFDADELVPRPEYALKVDPPDGVSVLAKYLAPIGLHYRPPQGETAFPMVAAGTRGKGQWLYLSCVPGRDWRRYRVPAWEMLVQALLRNALGDRLQLETDAPSTVQIELRRQSEPTGKRLLVHLINNSGNNQFPPSEIIPVGTFSVSIRAPEPARVYEADGDELSFTYRDSTVEFSIDLCVQYRLIVIEQKAAE